MLRPLQPLAAASSAASRRSLVPRLLLRQQPLLRRFSSSSRTGSRPGAGGGSAGSGGSGGSGQSSSNAWVNPLNRVPGGGGDKGDALHKYGSDLTAMAREGKLDTVVGRDEEIRRTIQVLSRRRKNNPVLIGEPGVGKTAVAEGLAQRIVDREVPDSMRSRRLIAVDMGALLPLQSHATPRRVRLHSRPRRCPHAATRTATALGTPAARPRHVLAPQARCSRAQSSAASLRSASRACSRRRPTRRGR